MNYVVLTRKVKFSFLLIYANYVWVSAVFIKKCFRQHMPKHLMEGQKWLKHISKLSNYLSEVSIQMFNLNSCETKFRSNIEFIRCPLDDPKDSLSSTKEHVKVEEATKKERRRQATNEPTMAKSVTGMLQGTTKALPRVKHTSNRVWDPGRRKEYVMFKGVNIRVKHGLGFLYLYV